MINYIQTFINALTGATLPAVIYEILAFILAYFVFRALFRLFNIKTKIIDYAIYVVVTMLAVDAVLGGFEWYSSLLHL